MWFCMIGSADQFSIGKVGTFRPIKIVQDLAIVFH